MSASSKPEPQSANAEVLQARITELENLQEIHRSTLEDLNVHQEELRAQNEQLRHTESQLEISQQRFQNLFHYAPIAFVVCDPTGGILEVNNKAAELMEFDRRWIKNHNLNARVLGTEQRGRFMQYLYGVHQGTASRKIELEMLGPDGKMILVEIYGSRDESIGQDYILLALIEVTYRLQFRKDQARLRVQTSALQAAANAITITDCDGTIEWVNQAFCALTGYTMEEVIGRTPRILLKSGQHDANFYQQLWRTILSGQVWHGEIVNRRKDGSLYCEEQTITPVINDKGHIQNFISVRQNITDRKQAERQLHDYQVELERHQDHLESLVAERTAELQDAEARARLILDSSADGIYGIDQNGRTTFINVSACKMLEYEPEQLLGRIIHPIIHYAHPDGRAYPIDECPSSFSLLHGKSIRSDDEVFWRADGTPMMVTYSTHPMLKDGKIVGAVVSFSDIRERKALEAAERKARSEAERLAQVKSDFLANMSHEIRTPLNAVLGLAQVGLRESSGRKVSEIFGRILDSGELLLGIINDILDFSKIEAGKLTIETRQSFDLGATIDRAVGVTAPHAHAKGIEFQLIEAPNLPQSCQGDPLRLSQILINLLSNAIKFTHAGYIQLHVEHHAHPQGPQLRFTITDTGIGMDAEHLERLFTPFEQADGSITRRFGGTGLGLSISKHLVELMGGTIEVHSTEGKGSRFHVTLPLRHPVFAASRPVTTQVHLAGLPDHEAEAFGAILRAHGQNVSVGTLDDPGLAADSILLTTSEAWMHSALCTKQNGPKRMVILAGSPEQIADSTQNHDGLRHIDRPLRVRHLLAAAAQSANPGAPASGESKPGQRLKGLRILAAEDNEVNRLVLAEMLEGEGAELIAAVNGQLAMDLLAASGPKAFHLLITDVQMPVLDGYATAKRSRELAPNLPVIGLTAHAMPEEEKRCLNAGMNAYMSKPVKLNQLVELILTFAQPRLDDAPVAAQAAPARAETTSQEPAPRLEIDPQQFTPDITALIAQYRGKTEFAAKLLRLAINNHGKDAEGIRMIAESGNYQQLQMTAHDIKGMASNLLVESLRQIAASTEEAASHQQPQALTMALQLASALEITLNGFATWLSTRSNSVGQ